MYNYGSLFGQNTHVVAHNTAFDLDPTVSFPGTNRNVEEKVAAWRSGAGDAKVSTERHHRCSSPKLVRIRKDRSFS
jgi:hypothetical protein